MPGDDCFTDLTSVTSGSSLLSKLGIGESNHRHWTKTGLPLSVSCSILVLEARNEQLLPPNNVGLCGGEHSLIDGVFGSIKGFEIKGLINFLCDGDVKEVLLDDFDLLGSEGDVEFDSNVKSVMEGEEDLELELDSDMVSVHKANLVVGCLKII